MNRLAQERLVLETALRDALRSGGQSRQQQAGECGTQQGLHHCSSPRGVARNYKPAGG